MKRPSSTQVAAVLPRNLLRRATFPQISDDDVHLYANDGPDSPDPLHIVTPLGPLVDSADLPLERFGKTYKFSFVNPFALMYTMLTTSPSFRQMVGAGDRNPCDISLQLWSDEVVTNNPLRCDLSGKYECFQLTISQLPSWARSEGGAEH